jgi:hypothetical protein
MLKRKTKKPAKVKKPREYKPLHPDWFYRKAEAGPYFGYKPTQLDEKIASREIPAPISVTASGRTKGWFGRTIIGWQTSVESK